MTIRSTILVCDDEDLIRWSLTNHLGSDGYDTLTATNGAEAVELVRKATPDLVLMDLKMPVVDGLSALREIRASGSEVPVIVLTAHGGVDSAIEATQLGASAYLSKPFELSDVSRAVRSALSDRLRKAAVHAIEGGRVPGYGEFIGRSSALDRMFETLERLEVVDAPTVLILGESGTGKDVLAQAIHRRGPRSGSAFVAVDCAAMPEQLIESELFGHERGAFTDARTTKRGLFEVAAGGIVFLDEIGEMSLGTQAKLLRAIESRTFKRVGGTAPMRLTAGIVVATNRDLRSEVTAGRFREDLYFRLNVVPLRIPALRERRDDVPLLVEHFLDRFNTAFGKQIEGVSGEAMELMKGYAWPGNVRELRNTLERVAILDPGTLLRAEHLPSEIRFARTARDRAGCPFELPEEGCDLGAVERGLIVQAMDRTNGNQSAAARLLGITRYALRYRLEKYELG
jgi:two-component system, NtrC family, response regulator AtoC